MRAIIFGGGGQDGILLSNLLRKKYIDVLAVSRSSSDCKGDISDFSFVDSIISTQLPDYVFHFAANSSTRHDAIFENHQAICTGTLNVLESVRLHCPKTKVFLSGSAMQFENEGRPINEKTPFEASSPYSIARIQSVYAARYYRMAFGMSVYVGYLFNHDSPLRTERHVNQKVVSAVKRIALGSKDKLVLGNIDVRKEFNYAGDVVEAIWLLVNQNAEYEIVIGSGDAYSIRDWVSYCFDQINQNWEDFVVIKTDFKSEYTELVSDPRLLKSLGWSPKVGFYQLADMMLQS